MLKLLKYCYWLISPQKDFVSDLESNLIIYLTYIDTTFKNLRNLRVKDLGFPQQG